MINDILYSTDQHSLHWFEGFGSRTTRTNLDTVTALPHALLDPNVPLGNELPPLDLFFGKIAYANTNTHAFPGVTRAAPDANVTRAVFGAYNDYSLFRYPTRLYATNPGDAPVDNLDTFAPDPIPLASPAEILLNISPVRLAGVTFCIPFYSSMLGVLMPVRKLVPMSLMNMELELTLNPYAFYSATPADDRNYVVRNVKIHSHILMFE